MPNSKSKPTYKQSTPVADRSSLLQANPDIPFGRYATAPLPKTPVTGSSHPDVENGSTSDELQKWQAKGRGYSLPADGFDEY